MRALMLVSADAGPPTRQAVDRGVRPCPEFLRLEQRHGVELLDLSSLGPDPGPRSTRRSLRHVRMALPLSRRVDVVLSDGEHVGVPLALLMRAARIDTPHVVLSHHLTTPGKTFILRATRAYRRMNRVLVHSANQVELIRRRLPALARCTQVVPYGVDTEFWSPAATLKGADGQPEDDLIVSAGREHRDYQTLVAARPDTARLFIADHSPFSPAAARRPPAAWPAGVERRALAPFELREMYARATIVVVPVVETTFPAGITTLLEAMAMGKAVISTGTAGLRGVVEDGRSGIVVPPGAAPALGRAIRELLAHPEMRQQLGAEARRVAVSRYSLDVYADELAGHLVALQARGRDACRQ